MKKKLLVLFIGIVISFPSLGQWNFDPKINTPVVKQPNNQGNYVMCKTTDGGYIVSWVDFRIDASGDIYAQKFSSVGVPQWLTDGMPVCTLANAQNQIHMVADDAGGAYIVWSDQRVSVSAPDIYATRITGSGTPGLGWSPNGNAISTAANAQTNPQVAFNGSNIFMVWEDDRTIAGNKDIYGIGYTPTGTVLAGWSASATAICSATNSQFTPKIIASSSDVFYMWSDNRPGTYFQTSAHRFSISGGQVWAANGIAISNNATAASAQSDLSLVLAGSNIVYGWKEAINSNDIVLKCLNPSNITVWGGLNGIAFCSGTTSNEQMLSMAASSDGQVLIGLCSNLSGTNDIIVQKISASTGTEMWTPGGIKAAGSTANETQPSLVADLTGGCVVSYLITNATQDVFAQKISSSGTSLWLPGGNPISNAVLGQNLPVSMPDGANGAVVCFTDTRNGNLDIYINAIDQNGNLPYNITAVPTSGPTGTSVTLTGNDFPGVGVDSVMLNGVTVGVFSSNCPSPCNSLTFTVPGSAPVGTWPIDVFNRTGKNTGLVNFTVAANTILTSPIPASPLCEGGPISVSFTSTGIFNGANVYRAELSTASGSFSSPVGIGNITSGANSGTISCIIPPGTPAGSGYRIRVVANDPITAGADNGANLIVNPAVTPTITISRTSGVSPICFGSPVTFTAAITGGGPSPSYQWQINGVNVGTNSSSFTTSSESFDYTIACILTSTAPCVSPAVVSSNSITQYIYGQFTVNVGSDATLCASDGSINLNGIITGVGGGVYSYGVFSMWGTTGDGGFFDNTIPNTDYYFGPNDRNGGVIKIFMDASDPCATVTDTFDLTILTNPTTPIVSSNSPVCETGALNLSGPTVVGAMYSWNGPNGFTSVVQNPTITNAGPVNSGIYTLFVSVSGCSSPGGNTNVTVNPALTATYGNTNVTCIGGNNGSITFTSATGGSGSYEYSIDNGSSWQTGVTFSGLLTGSYNLIIRDAVNITCSTFLGLVVITQPAALNATSTVTDESCAGSNDGSIVFSGSTGGSGAYEYSIDNGLFWQSSTTYGSLSAGNYNLVIRDGADNSCTSALGSVTVTATPVTTIALTSSAATINQTVCQNTAIANITYSITGAAGASVTNLPSGVTGSYAGGIVTISGVPTTPGVLSYLVTPTGGCGPATASGNINVNATPVLSASQLNLCAGAGTVAYNTTSQTGNWSVGISNGASGSITSGSVGVTAVNVGPFTYSGTPGTVQFLQNVSGCTGSVTITVAPSPVTSAITGANSVCSNTLASPYSVTFRTGSTYVWSIVGGTQVSGGNSNSITVDWNAAGGGSVSVQETNGGCTGPVVNLPVTVNLAPTISAGADQTICAGSSTTLSGTPGGSATGGTWGGGSGSFSPAVNALNAVYTPTAAEITAGSVTLTIVSTGGGCPVVNDQVTITIIPTPLPPTTGGDNICSGNTGTVTASGAGTIKWYDSLTGGLFLSSGSGYTTGILSSTTDFYAETSVGPGCVSTRSIATVTVDTPPSVPGSITGSLTYCNGGTGSYNVPFVSGVSYNWTLIGGGTISSGQGTNIITVGYSTSPTQVCVTANNICGTSASSCLSITGFSSPLSPTSITGPNSVCPNQTGVSYTCSIVAGATIYIWSLPAGATQTSGGTTNSITVDFGTSGGNVNVAASNPCGTSGNQVLPIAVGSPSVMITNPASVCTPLGVDLTDPAIISGSIGVTGYGYFSDAAATMSLATPNNIGFSGTFYIKGSAPGGCYDIQPVSATVNTTPSAPTTTGDNICSGNTGTVSAVGSGTISWYDASTGGTFLGTGSSYTTGTLVATSNYYAEDALGGCVSASRSFATVTVNSAPASPTVTNNSGCSGTNITLSANQPGGNEFRWYDASTGGILIYNNFSNPNSSVVINNVTVNTTVYVEYFDGICLSARVPVTASVLPSPTVIITDPAPVCSPSTVDLTQPSIKAGSTPGLIFGAFSDAAATSPLATPASIGFSGTFYIKGTDGSGCYDIKPVVTIVNSVPPAPTTTGDNQCTGSIVTATGSGTIGWYDSPTGGAFLGSGPSFSTGTLSSTTSFYAEDVLNGCASTSRGVATVTISIPPVPTTTGDNQCTGSIVTATGSGSIGWYDSPTGGAFLGSGPSFSTGTLSSTTNFYAEDVLNGCASTSRGVATVTISIPPVPTTTGDNQCTGSIVTATGSGTIGWYDSPTGGAFLGSGPSFSTGTLSSTTSFYAEDVLNGCASASRGVATVTVSIPPAPTTTGDNQCTGSIVTATGSGTIGWYDSPTGGVFLGSGPSFSTGTLSSTTSFYAEDVLNGCTSASRGVATVTVSIPPAPTTTGDNQCSGSIVTATGSGTISWFDSPTGGTFLGSGSSFSTGPLSSTTSFYAEDLVNGCSSSSRGIATVTITTPTATLSGGTSICASGTDNLLITFTGGSGPWDFTYTDGVTSFNITGATNPYSLPVSPAATTTYSLTVVTEGSCNGTVSGTATTSIIPAPTAALSGGTSICASGTDNLLITFTGGSGPWDFTYTDGVTSFNITGATNPYSLPVSPAATTTYSLTVVTEGSCNGTVSGTATTSIIQAPTAMLSGGTSICASGTDNLLIAFTGGTGPWDFTYTDGVTSFNITGATNPYSLPVSPAVTTTYSLTAVTEGACAGTVSGTATTSIIPAPTAALSGGTSICASGTDNLTINFTGGTGPWDFTYTDGVSSFNITGATNPYSLPVSPAATTTYSLTAVTEGACAGMVSGTATTNVVSAPVITAAGGITQLCNGSIVTLSVPAAFTTYQWKLGTSLIVGETNPTYVVVTPGSYSVDVTGSCGGSSSAIVITNTASTPTITASGGVSNDTLLTTVAGASSYQWYAGQRAIYGANSNQYRPYYVADYSVSLGFNNCRSKSTVYTLNNSSMTLLTRHSFLMTDTTIFIPQLNFNSRKEAMVYPNPSEGNFTVAYKCTTLSGKVTMNIYNTMGNLMTSKEFIVHSSVIAAEFDDVKLSSGIYMIYIAEEDQVMVKTISIY